MKVWDKKERKKWSLEARALLELTFKKYKMNLTTYIHQYIYYKD